MSELQMFEKSFQRPWYYFTLPESRQWEIDKELGILDWDGRGLTNEQRERFHDHYKRPKGVVKNA